MTDQEEYQAYLASQGHAPAAAPTNDRAEYEQYLRETGQAAPQTEWQAAKSIGGAAASGVGRALNLGGGLLRTTVAGGAEMAMQLKEYLSGQEAKRDHITKEDFINALHGKAASSAEYMDRLGVPEGDRMDYMPWEVKVPFTDITLGKGDTSARDMAGFIGDTVLDPLTYVPYVGQVAALKRAAQARGLVGLAARGTITGAEKINSALNLPMNAVAGVGKATYVSGLKRIDSLAEAMGKAPVSELLMKHGIAGSNKQIMAKMNTLGDNLLAERNALEDAAGRAGAETSMKRAVEPVRAHAAGIRADRNPQLQDLAGKLEGQANTYEALDRQYAMTPIEKAAEKIDVVDLPLQGADFTPIQRREAVVQEMGGLPMQSSEFTPIQPRNAVVNETEQLLPGQTKNYRLSENSGVLYGAPVEPMYGIERTAPGMEKAGPTQFSAADTGPQVIRTPARMERAGRAQMEARSTGPLQTYEPARMQRSGPSTYETPGVTPSQSSGYKTTMGAGLPDTAFKDQGFINEVNKATKISAGGMKDATEEAIGRGLGAAPQARYREANDELGRLLTTQDKQAMEVAKAANKDYFTSIDGAILATSPMALASKKAADLFRTSLVRTQVGKAVNNFGRSEGNQALMRNMILRGITSPSRTEGDELSQYERIKRQTDGK